MEHALEEIEIVAAVGGQILHLNADFAGELLQILMISVDELAA